MRRHSNGTGAQFTRNNKPLSIVETILFKTDEEARCAELTKTIQLMAEKEVENVRGGPYCQIWFSDETLDEIERLIDHIKDRCFRCHKEGHKRNDFVCQYMYSKQVPTKSAVGLPGEPMSSNDDSIRPVDLGSTVVTTKSSTPPDKDLHIREIPSKNKRWRINRHCCCRIS